MPSKTDLTCAECTLKLTTFQTDLLPEEDRAIVDEHLSECPNCRLFQDQVAETTAFVENLPLRESAAALALSMGDLANSAEGADDAGEVLTQLCRLADSLDPDRAEDLVQGVFLSTVERDPDRLDFKELARDLVDTASSGQTSEAPFVGLRDLDARGWGGENAGLDADADGAELYYPEFYETGPELGQFVDVPNVWGATTVLTPEEDVDTGELYGVVDAALAQLPEPLGQLMQLVDIEDLSIAEATSALRLSNEDAASGLNRARIHVRGALDATLS